MKRIVWVVLGLLILQTCVHAGTAPESTPAASGAFSDQSQGYKIPDDEVSYSYEKETPYGLVRIDEDRRTLFVNGKEEFNSDKDVLLVNGEFKLGNEYVIQFDDANTGSGGLPSQSYFLILKSNAEPKVLTNKYMENVGGIERVWQENESVYVDLGSKTIARLHADKITVRWSK